MPPAPPPVQCLVVVDMQEAFVHGPEASPQIPHVLPAVRHQLEAARAAGSLVVHLQNDGGPGTADEPGTAGWRLTLSLSTETVVRKTEDSGFVGTSLHEHLQRHGVSALSICGVMSEMCVAATARDAMQLGYEVVLAHDSHGTYPVPPFGPGERGVTAEDAARAAEWSLGDTIHLPPEARAVRFVGVAGDGPQAG